MNVDYTYYRDIYHGCNGEEIIPYLKSAADLLCSAVTAEDVTACEDVIKYAVCIQADSDMAGQIRTVRIGDYSETKFDAGRSVICPSAYMYLERAGLCCRAVSVCRQG